MTIVELLSVELSAVVDHVMLSQPSHWSLMSPCSQATSETAMFVQVKTPLNNEIGLYRYITFQQRNKVAQRLQ